MTRYSDYDRVYTKIRNLYLHVDCQLKLFDNTVVPILLYACEVWGYGDLHLIEKVHTDFMKYILSVKKTTPMLCCMAILDASL